MKEHTIPTTPAQRIPELPVQVFPMGSLLSFPVCGVPITGVLCLHHESYILPTILHS